MRGDARKLTDSQQITVAGAVREPRANIRDHSDATHVTIGLSTDAVASRRPSRTKGVV